MKLTFALALATGATNAAQLRIIESTRNVKPTRMLRKSKTSIIENTDISLIESLANKYNCHEAGSTLEETLSNIIIKNAVETRKLRRECTKRRKEYNTLWTAAQAEYTTKFPKVKIEETVTYTSKIDIANKNLADIKHMKKVAVAKAQASLDFATSDLNAKIHSLKTTTDAWEAAKKSYEQESNYYLTVTKPARLEENLEAFNKAMALAFAEFQAKMAAARATRSQANKVCESITANRKKHVDADEKLLKNEIAPLIKQLSKLKCVDSYDDQRKAAGLNSAFIEINSEITEEQQAKCAIYLKDTQAFLESTHILGALPINSQYKTFINRIAEEHSHMTKVHNKCIGAASTLFSEEEFNATSIYDASSASNTDTRKKADQVIEDIYKNIVDMNKKNIAEKKNAMVGPQKNLLVSRKSFSAATINLDSKKSEQASEVAAAVTEHKMITNEALKTKLANIEARESTLDAIKKTAERKFEEEKKFVEEYCASSAKDLKKESDIVEKINAKLTGLAVIKNTAKKGKAIVTSTHNLINNCAKNTCKNKGQCVALDENYYQCECPRGYYGKFCEYINDYCAKKLPCRNNGICVDGLHSYTCVCAKGFRGENCEIDVNECLQSKCQNNAKCVDQINGYRCECVKGTKGEHCEQKVSKCADKPCFNGGSCIEYPNPKVTKEQGFLCKCPTGFSGPQCQKKEKECPCKTKYVTPAFLEEGARVAPSTKCVHGTCGENRGIPRCECFKHWKGKYCDEPMKDVLATVELGPNGVTKVVDSISYSDISGAEKAAAAVKASGALNNPTLADKAVLEADSFDMTAGRGRKKKGGLAYKGTKLHNACRGIRVRDVASCFAEAALDQGYHYQVCFGSISDCDSVPEDIANDADLFNAHPLSKRIALGTFSAGK
jgi:hypothetical protein